MGASLPMEGRAVYKEVQKAALDMSCPHMKFPDEHVSLSIYLTILSVNMEYPCHL